jgi:hypothetical protein
MNAMTKAENTPGAVVQQIARYLDACSDENLAVEPAQARG